MHTRTSRIGRTTAAALALGVALTVAGCGNQASTAGHTGSSSGGVTYADKALTKDQVMQAAYAAAMKAGSAHMVMSITGKSAMNAHGDVAYGHGSPAMQMTMSMAQMGQKKLEMRYVGKVLYLQIPQLVPPGKFVAIDPRDKNNPLAKSFGSTTDQMDPMKSLQAVESAVQSAERTGKTTLDGTTVEHYKVTVDTSALVAKLAPQAAAQAHLPKTMTYDLWLDQQHLLRKMSFDLMGEHFTATMSKWGEPVHVDKPKASQITTMGQPQA